VLFFLIGFGAFIAAGFVFSLHQHFAANAIGREEVRLKSNLDQLGSEQRHLGLQRARALSPRELERRATQQSGLAPLRLDQPVALRLAPTAAGRANTKRRPEAAPGRATSPVQRSDD
jgi:hypothetical protein